MIDLNSQNELKWVAEGRVFHSRHGELTTVQSFRTNLVRQEPALWVVVPAGVVIVPLRVTINVESSGAEVFKALISTCTNAIGTSSGTLFAPVNQNTKFATRGSKVLSYRTSTGTTGTAPANVVDLHRVYIEARIDATTDTTAVHPFEQVVYSPLQGRGLPAVVGQIASDSCFIVYAANGTSGDGFAMAVWAEFDWDEFYG